MILAPDEHLLILDIVSNLYIGGILGLTVGGASLLLTGANMLGKAIFGSGRGAEAAEMKEAADQLYGAKQATAQEQQGIATEQQDVALQAQWDKLTQASIDQAEKSKLDLERTQKKQDFATSTAVESTAAKTMEKINEEYQRTLDVSFESRELQKDVIGINYDQALASAEKERQSIYAQAEAMDKSFFEAMFT